MYQNNSGYNVCKGETHLINTCVFIDALLTFLHSSDQQSFLEEKLQLIWKNEKTLEITGKHLKNNKRYEGTTNKVLLELVKQHRPSFSEHNLRNSISLLTELTLMKEEKTVHKYKGFRKYILKLNRNESKSVKIGHVKKQLEKKYQEFDYFIQDEAKSTKQGISPQELELLSSFNCNEQKDIFDDYTRNNSYNKRNVFIIQADSRIQPWFLWHILKSTGQHFENSEKINIKINFLEKTVDYLYQEIKKYLRLENNASHETVIQNLSELCQKKSVFIFIKQCGCLSPNELDNLYNFCSKLVGNNSGTSQKDKNSFSGKLYFVIFLLQVKEERKILYPQLKLEQFTKKELRRWLTAHRSIFLSINDNFDKVCEKYDDALDKIDPLSLIDSICKDVLNLNNGLADVEHYWQDFK